jgi:hypothetical protein
MGARERRESNGQTVFEPTSNFLIRKQQQRYQPVSYFV